MPFLLILGTSGSGKSSLARAGLAPRLTQPGAVLGVDVWRSCVMRPSEGDGFLDALARALYGGDAVPELAQGDNPAPPDMAALLRNAPDAAARAVRLGLVRGAALVGAREGFDRPVEARLLLVVDQFEEALTPTMERDLFARALAALAATGVVWIIATLRSDLYAPFQASAPLMALRDQGAQLDLLPPEQAELAEIITGPAAAAGLLFDRRPDGVGLDEELAKAADQPGALPLLQLVLDALFEARDPASSTLTCAAYDALGGLSGVVERRAEATLSALDAEAAAALPGVLRALVDVTGEGLITSRAAPASAVAPSDPARRLVAAFVAARLLVADTRGAEASVRVAHDALLSGWPRAAGLLASDREMLRTRFRAEAAARRWVQEGRDADFLLPAGRPLAEAAELLALRPESLDADATSFIKASQQAEAARAEAAAAQAQRELRLEAEAQQARADAATKVMRRTRLAAALVSALLLAAAAAAIFANFQRQEAERQTAQAERNFRTALDAGASLIDAVNAHLRDGGMTRRVAGELLDTANATMGGLAQSAAAAPPLQDAQSRLQASFSGVQLALCDSVGARARAADAVTLAERVFAQFPTDERKRALALALDTQGQALRGDGDPKGAMAVYRRAEAVAQGQAGTAWADVQRLVRRDMATSLLDLTDYEGAQALLRDDLAWQQDLSRAHPDDPAALGLAALDLRGIAFARLGQGDLTAGEQALAQEAETLHRLTALRPADLMAARPFDQYRAGRAHPDGSRRCAGRLDALPGGGDIGRRHIGA